MWPSNSTIPTSRQNMAFKSLNDVRHCYTYRSFVYAGKPTETPSPFYVSGTDNYVKELVESLARKVPLDGRNISMDRLYTSIPIAEWPLTKNITCIGTMLTRRVGISEEIKTTRNQELFSTRVFWEKKEGDLSIASYVVPTSKSVRNVLVLTTTRPLLGVTKVDGRWKEEAGDYQVV